MAAAFSLVQGGRELVLLGRDDEQTEGEVMDLQHAVAVPMVATTDLLAVEASTDAEKRTLRRRL